MKIKCTRFLSIVVLFSTVMVLNAQSNEVPEQWVSLNNLFFKHKDVTQSNSQISTLGDSLLVVDESLDRQFSFGVSFRRLRKNNTYEEFDVFALNWARNRNWKQTQKIESSLTEPFRGRESKNLNMQIGYQRGKYLPILPQLNADIGLRGYTWYESNNDTPLALGTSGFPLDTRSIGLGLNLELGLNYQIIKQLNIGYRIIPIAGSVFWHEVDVNDPAYPPSENIEREIKADYDLFQSLIGWRNFHISYCF